MNKKNLRPAALAVIAVLILAPFLSSCSCGGAEPESQSVQAAENPGESGQAVKANVPENDDPETVDPAGVYEITAMISEGKETSSEDLALMKSRGLDCRITLEQDGTGILDLFGEEIALTWDGETISTAEKAYSYTLEGDQLTLENGNSSLTFMRTE